MEDSSTIVLVHYFVAAQKDRIGTNVQVIFQLKYCINRRHICVNGWRDRYRSRIGLLALFLQEKNRLRRPPACPVLVGLHAVKIGNTHLVSVLTYVMHWTKPTRPCTMDSARASRARLHAVFFAGEPCISWTTRCS